MLGSGNVSQTVNNYISGGVGGHGGESRALGTGGDGGDGLGPILTTNIEAATVHFHQNNRLGHTSLRLPVGSEEGSHELPGTTRTHLRNKTRARETPYDRPSRLRPSLKAVEDGNSLSDSASFLKQSMPSPSSGPVSHSNSGTSHPTSASTNRGLALPNPLSIYHPVDDAEPDDLSTQPSLDWGRDESLLCSKCRHQFPRPLRSMHAPTFITTETLNHHHPGEPGIDIMHRAVVLDALSDSADSIPRAGCHPKTRTETLESLYNWAIQRYDPRALSPIRWLRGPAGAGKSAIMQTLCQNLEQGGRRAAAFFFKRDHATRGNAKALFTTLAYQLALYNSELKCLISHCVECDPSVVGRSMEVQLHRLIVEPCESLTNCLPVIILIDGLDECQDENIQQGILHLIKSAVATHRHSSILRFLIASRPEAHIQETFDDPSFDGILDCVTIKQSFEDINKYLLDEFARIRREHRTMVNVPSPWPSWETLRNLVEKSSGYFVYASTVIKFIDNKYSRPTEGLKAIESLAPADDDVPFATLDQLYKQILS
ncbi:hypothetical protein B0H14DRAFT_2436921, partial [Mycena olivaceomarginata]